MAEMKRMEEKGALGEMKNSNGLSEVRACDIFQFSHDNQEQGHS